MNLLFLHSSSDLYGASKILLDVSKQARDAGHRVTVVVSKAGPLTEALKEQGIGVSIIPLGVLRRKYMNPLGFVNRLRIIRKAFQELKRFCQQEGIDLIYSNTTGILVGTFVAKACGIRHIWHVHEIIEQPKILHRLIGRLLNRKNNEVIVVSKAVKDHWSKMVDPAQMVVLYNGVDAGAMVAVNKDLRAELGIPKEALLMGMMGRVHYWKGQDYFLEIAAILQPLFQGETPLHFLLVGDPFPGYEYLYQEMDSIIQQNQLQDKVHICGYRSDIANVYQALDLFVLPSLQPDPAPAVVTEAMAAGKAVVVTKQGGAIEMIEEGLSGLTIPIGNAQRAAEIIAPLLRKEADRKKMGDRAKERVINFFTRETFHKNILACINQKKVS